MAFNIRIGLLMLPLLVAGLTTFGQERKEPAGQVADIKPASRPTNVRMIEEYDDGKGHLIRKIRYQQNNSWYTETIIRPIVAAPKADLHRLIKPDTLIKDSLEIIVSKSKYKVDVFYKRQQIRSYIAVFGPKPYQNKCMEGDRCTPEGTFHICMKNPASQYDRFMLLDYPNDSARMRFNALKASGSLPATAKIGGNIGIHGIWHGGDDMIELGVGWTDGCIALKNKDVEELFKFAGVGTKVTIKR